MDDFHFFCKSKEDAIATLYRVAEIFDIQQKLTIQRSKTEIFEAKDFIEVAKNMLLDRN